MSIVYSACVAGRSNLTWPNSSPDPVFATILVGPDKKRFIVHETVLVHHSEYFRAALTSGFSEAKDKTITIEDACAETFEFFVHWLYYQRVPSKKNHDNPELVNRFYHKDRPNDENLAKLYIFADAHQVPTLRKALIAEIFARLVNPVGVRMSVSAIENAFEHLQVKDTLCRLLVNQQCRNDVLNDPQRANFKNLAYMKAVWERYVYLTNTPGIAVNNALNICDYHEHLNDEERISCERKRKLSGMW